MRDKLNNWLFRAWLWFGRKILNIPFVLDYRPPPGDRLWAVTFSWSLEYVQRLQRLLIAYDADLQRKPNRKSRRHSK